MTCNVFVGTLSLSQSINHCQTIQARVVEIESGKHTSAICYSNRDIFIVLGRSAEQRAGDYEDRKES